ncbi:alkylated DNA repair protein alkB homolog 8 [Lethenteron reissneri]|uniref:alkylated DNA repair protein alkB homolog 8 n=1 Tax=Lethenteron reissneri TaxID=7753 RepID=UPI002AB749C3|nr:alkylated DNA repair protein alkB homolog 8 [Lethenteron reissneri]
MEAAAVTATVPPPSPRGDAEEAGHEGRGGRKVRETKADRKGQRRLRKARLTLLRLDGVQTVDHPTQHLLIANGGLGNGVARATLLELMGAQGHLEALETPRGRPYAFASFSSVHEAQGARRKLDGCSVSSAVATAPVTLHLCHVERVPRQESCTEALPPGLKLIPDCVSSEYEDQLLSCLDWGRQQPTAQQSLKHRCVQHFGYEFRYDNNNVDKDKPLDRGVPAMCDELTDKCLSAGYIQHRPNQLTVNQYQPGQGIPPHIDTHSAFEDGIMSLSLGASTVMEFRHPDGSHASVLLPRRSLLVMAGESRYLWSHGITPRKFDVVPAPPPPPPGDGAEGPQGPTLAQRGVRTSFTFRTVRREPCRCRYPSVCDSQAEQQNLQTPSSRSPINEPLPSTAGMTTSGATHLGPSEESRGPDQVTRAVATERVEAAAFSHPARSVDAEDDEEKEEEEGDAAQRLETEHVHRVYEQIAGHFSSTRHSPWPRVAAFVQGLRPGALVCDVGCGNGKYLGLAKGSYVFGCDRSAGLVGICEQRGFQALVCDALALPVRTGACDACLSIAVIHHLSTQDRRLEALRELLRILRPGGRALVYVWALEQQYRQARSKYLKPKHGETVGGGTGPQPVVGVGETADDEKGTSCTPTNGVKSPCDDVAESSRPAEPAPVPPEPRRDPGMPTRGHLPVHTNRTPFRAQDVLVPWHHRRQGETPGPPERACEEAPVYHRYYHVFREGELEALCARLDGARVLESYYDQGNWCVVVEKY